MKNERETVQKESSIINIARIVGYSAEFPDQLD